MTLLAEPSVGTEAPASTVAASPDAPRPVDPARRRYWLLIGFALLASFGVRLVLAVNNDVITNDGSAYLTSGASIWAGDGFQRGGDVVTPSVVDGQAA